MPRTPQDRVKVNVYLDKKVLDGLKKVSSARGTTYSELIRVAARDYLVKEGPKVLAEQRAIASTNAPITSGIPEDNDPRERA
jgi:metal-responsive CopG/Arc/MetJ family transcriptional regulator